MPALVGEVVYDIDRCPQCGVASPLLTMVCKPAKHHKDPFDKTWWHFTAACSRCKRHVLFFGASDSDREGSMIKVRDVFPALETVPSELPEKARKFLQQAIESKHAPDGVLMLAASSIDAMLKEIGLRSGTLYSRFEKAQETGVLTAQMRDWAHEIRLGANEPRHADDDFDGATPEDADQTIEFAKALAEYLFVLPARVKKWKAAAKTES